MTEDDDRQKTAEAAYCKRLMEQIVAFELDPKNFTREMRAGAARRRSLLLHDQWEPSGFRQ